MPVEPVILETILTGWREVVTGVQAEVAAMEELGLATKMAGNEATVAARKQEILTQATFTARRVAYAGTLALIAAGAAVLKLGWNYQSAMQQARVALQPVFHGTHGLTEELLHLYRVTAFTPFQFKDVTIAWRQMFAGLKYAPGVQNPVELTNKTLQSMIDALSFAGKVAPMNLQRVSLALQHMAYAGRLTGYSLNQLWRDGIPMAAILNKEFGITGEQLHNISSYNIPVQDVLDAINKFIESTPGYKNAAFLQATKTLHGAWTTFKDLLSQASAGSGQGIFGGVQKFLTTVDQTLYGHLYSKKPVTMVEFMKAVDQAVSPRTHLLFDTFRLLQGILEGIKEDFMAVATAIWLVLTPLMLLEKVLGIPGAKYGLAYAFQVLGFLMGIYIGALLLVKMYTIAAAVAEIIYTAVQNSRAVITRLNIFLTYAYITAQWLYAAATRWATAAAVAFYISQWGVRASVIANAIAMRASMIIFWLLEAAMWAGTAAAAAETFAIGLLVDAWIAANALIDAGILIMEMSIASLAGVWTAALGLMDIALAGFSLAVDAAASAWIFLDLVMGPVGWIILAIALITGLYLRWQWFHNLVNSTAQLLRDHWVLAIMGMISPFLLATILIVENFQKILNFAQKMWDWFSKHNIFQMALNFIMPFGLGNVLGGAMGGGPGGAGGAGGAWYTHPWDMFKYASPEYWVGRGVKALIPGLQGGGHIVGGGLAMVGERGPELLALPGGATVRSSHQALGGGGGFSIRIYPQAIHLDGKKIGEVMATAVTDAEARQ